jgi:hypothetical protein
MPGMAVGRLHLDQQRRASVDQREDFGKRRDRLVGAFQADACQLVGTAIDERPALVGQPLKLGIVKDKGFAAKCGLNV